ncbi:hypothetical protein L596_011371 [Steinernema carpocapsae]|uniref:Uncharacterized protein n=1 Tax=Steinernema carpocapsae TaxID=34508 RepID=A0A4U5NUK0_STECR|nr:hypothetical protein L596_011371 [Steinernema carpocapsae]
MSDHLLPLASVPVHPPTLAQQLESLVGAFPGQFCSATAPMLWNPHFPLNPQAFSHAPMPSGAMMPSRMTPFFSAPTLSQTNLLAKDQGQIPACLPMVQQNFPVAPSQAFVPYGMFAPFPLSLDPVSSRCDESPKTSKKPKRKSADENSMEPRVAKKSKASKKRKRQESFQGPFIEDVTDAVKNLQGGAGIQLEDEAFENTSTSSENRITVVASDASDPSMALLLVEKKKNNKIEMFVPKGTFLLRLDDLGTPRRDLIWCVDNHRLIVRYDRCLDSSKQTYLKTNRYAGWMCNDPESYFVIGDVVILESGSRIEINDFPSAEKLAEARIRMITANTGRQADIWTARTLSSNLSQKKCRSTQNSLYILVSSGIIFTFIY